MDSRYYKPNAVNAGRLPGFATNNTFQRLGPSGRYSSLTLLLAISGGACAVQVGIGFLSGGYSDSIGPQTSSTRSVNRSPISRSVTVPFRCGNVRTNWPKLKPS